MRSKRALSLLLVAATFGLLRPTIHRDGPDALATAATTADVRHAGAHGKPSGASRASRGANPFAVIDEATVPVERSTPPPRDANRTSAARAAPALASAPDAPTVDVTGTVVDVDGIAIVGARVYLSSKREHAHGAAITDAGGAFSFDGVAPGDDYRLAVAPPRRYRPRSLNALRVDSTRGPTRVVLESIPTGSVAGSVVDAEGLPVARTSLVVYGGESTLPSFTVDTDPDGGFFAPDIVAGHVVFALRAPAYVPVHEMSVDADDVAHARIVLDRPWNVVRGRVSDDDDAPLGGLVVQFAVAGVASSRATAWWTTTDTDGTFTTWFPTSKARELSIRAPGTLPYARTVDATSGYLRIRMDPVR